MIKNQLAVLMAKRLEKITKVAKATGISRTTLTSIYYRREKYISYEVLEKLCDYFNCELSDFLTKEKDVQS